MHRRITDAAARVLPAIAATIATGAIIFLIAIIILNIAAGCGQPNGACILIG